ncbi:protein muscleblind-like isoform X1 [Andrena cerasifolii]|uniref:protein muscleblind-like isoform X1 n=1 Tax=Andrena cerasifolii TaxID=2819439 RepID=UPI0040384272
MAMVNMNNLLNGKDSRWLQLEVCREFQRNKCTRPDTECKFAHPPANVEVQNGRVTACYDSIKVSPPTISYKQYLEHQTVGITHKAVRVLKYSSSLKFGLSRAETRFPSRAEYP